MDLKIVFNQYINIIVIPIKFYFFIDSLSLHIKVILKYLY